ncbi:MAG: hypothetical protein F6K16_29575, partial [Symploca sp. SIO2B6]|nr:hypothetical protein [Symploca sp. SIO2B6]
ITYLLSAVMLLLLMLAIAPQRQALLDWSRYQSKTLNSWLWADKSPMLLAMVLHLIMVYSLLVPWTFLTGVSEENLVGAIISFIGVANTLLIYGFCIQTILAGRFTNPIVWAIGGLIVWLIVPPAMLALLQLTPDNIPASTMLWTILGYPFFEWDNPVSLLFTQFGLIVQWGILGVLIWWCDRTFKQLAKAS